MTTLFSLAPWYLFFQIKFAIQLDFEKTSSKWATPEMQEAYENDLIPDIMEKTNGLLKKKCSNEKEKNKKENANVKNSILHHNDMDFEDEDY